MPYVEHQLLAKIAVAVVVGLICLYYLRVVVIAVRHHRLESRLKLKQRDLLDLSADVNRLSQDDSHWKQLFEEISPLDPQGVTRWLEQMRTNA
jgi:hypothetical protein